MLDVAGEPDGELLLPSREGVSELCRVLDFVRLGDPAPLGPWDEVYLQFGCSESSASSSSSSGIGSSLTFTSVSASSPPIEDSGLVTC